MYFNLAVILRETADTSPGKAVAVYAGGQMTYGNWTLCRTGRRPAWRRPACGRGPGWRSSCPTSRSSRSPISGSSRPAAWEDYRFGERGVSRAAVPS